MDIQVGDRVTYENGVAQVLNSEYEIEQAIGSVVKIIKIERPKWEVVEEKKDLLTEEEREFLKAMIKYYKVDKVRFYIKDINLYDENGHILNYPDYPENMKFEGVERNRLYTLSELGLEE